MIPDKFHVYIILVVLGVFNSSYGDIPPVEPAGLWYVAAVNGYNNTLSIPKCWTVTISEPLKDGNFEGDSNFVNNVTSQHHHAHFRAILYTDRSSLDNMYHRFELGVTIEGIKQISVESITLYQYVTSHNTAVLSNMTITGQTWNYFDRLFISRTPEIDPNISLLLFDVMRIDNSNCSSTSIERGL